MSQIVMKGMLWKRGGFRKNWKPRYFVLEAGELKYFESESATKAKGVIATSSITEVDKSSNAAVKLDKKLSGQMIELKTPGRHYFIVVPDEQVDAWIAAIRSWIAAPAAPTSLAPTSTVAAAAAAAAAASASAPAAAVAVAASSTPAVDATAEAAAKKAPPPTPGAKPAAAVAAVASTLAVPGEAGEKRASPTASPRGALNRSPRVSRDLSKSAQAAIDAEHAAAAAAAAAPAVAPVLTFAAYETQTVEVALQSIEAFTKQTGFTVLPFNELFAKWQTLEKKNGAIDKAAFCALVKGMFGPDQGQLIEAIFEYVDIDSGGSLDGGEVLCMLNLFCSGAVADKLATCFAAFDDDNSNTLSEAEFKKMVLYALSRSRQLLEEILGAYYPPELSLESAVMVKLPKVDEFEAARFADDAFASADADKSGSIDKAEFLAWASADPVFSSFLRTHDKVFGAGAVPALLVELAPPSYEEDIVRVSRRGVDAFVAKTGFKPQPFAALVAQLTALAGDDAPITQDAFAALLGGSFVSNQRELLDALYDYFDADESGSLDPAEVLCCLNLLAYGPTQEKLRLCFSAYDEDKSNALDVEELQAMLHSTLVSSRNVLVELIGAFTEDPADVESASTSIALMSLNEREVRQLTERLFAEADADGSGHVDFAEFSAWALANRHMLDFFGTHGALFGQRPDENPDDCALIALEGVRSFVQKTNFKPLPFADLLAKFRSLPKADDGALHKANFTALVADLFGGGAEQADLIDAIFDFLDIDGGGSLSAAETVCALNTFCSGTADEKAKLCFEAFDTDGGGTLDRNEWIHLFKTTLVQSRDLLVELMGAFIEDPAFDLATAPVIKLQKVSLLSAESVAEVSFGQADASGDGHVSADEFVAFAARNELFRSFFGTHDKLFGATAD